MIDLADNKMVCDITSALLVLTYTCKRMKIYTSIQNLVFEWRIIRIDLLLGYTSIDILCELRRVIKYDIYHTTNEIYNCLK